MLFTTLRHSFFQNRSGNVFAMLFGGVALVGILGATTMQFIRGPLTTAVNVNRATTAETQMVTSTQLAMTTAAGQAKDGDCDDDTLVEPLPWKAPGSKPSPQDVTGSDGGGMIPDTIGTSKSDPWGTEYGYCVWDHGAAVKHADCDGTDNENDRRLAGGNTKAAITIAIISAGKDRKFETQCLNKTSADSNGDSDGNLDPGEDLVVKTGSNPDDLVYTRTYSEAAESSGGLWSLETSASDTATIDKKASVGELSSGSFSDYEGNTMFANEGLVLGQFSTSDLPACDGLQNVGMYVYDTTAETTKRCNDSGNWDRVGGLWFPDSSNDFITYDNSKLNSPAGLQVAGKNTSSSSAPEAGNIAGEALEQVLKQGNNAGGRNAVNFGNVGIGTSSPNSSLQIKDKQGQISLTDTQNFSDIADYMELDVKSDDFRFIWHDDSAGTDTELMRVTKNGRVGIGTSSPGSDEVVSIFEESSIPNTLKLDAAENPNLAFEVDDQRGANIRVNHTSGNNDLEFAVQESLGGSGQSIMHLMPSGDVGIGTGNPKGKLDIEGGIAGLAMNNASSGQRLEWGVTNFSGMDAEQSNYFWQTVSFDNGFSSTPIVFCTVQTENGPQNATVCQAKNKSQDSFDLGFCQAIYSDSTNDASCDSHSNENVAWVAIGPR